MIAVNIFSSLAGLYLVIRRKDMADHLEWLRD
jgi:hypothetical protein